MYMFALSVYLTLTPYICLHSVCVFTIHNMYIYIHINMYIYMSILCLFNYPFIH